MRREKKSRLNYDGGPKDDVNSALKRHYNISLAEGCFGVLENVAENDIAVAAGKEGENSWNHSVISDLNQYFSE